LDRELPLNQQKLYKKRLGKQFFSLEECQKWLADSTLDNGKCIGWWIPTGYVVADVDQKGLVSNKIAKALNIKTLKIKTFKGVHFVFSTPDKFVQNAGTFPFGLTGDFKIGGSGYITLPFGAHAREMNRKFLNKIPPVPLPLEFTIWPKYDNSLAGKIEGTRNNALFEQMCEYKGRGASDDQIRAMAPLINRYVFDDPWPDDEEANEIAEKVILKPDVTMRHVKNPYLFYTPKKDAEDVASGVNQPAIVRRIIEDNDTIVLGNGLGGCFSYVNGRFIDDNTLTLEEKVDALIDNERLCKAGTDAEVIKKILRSKELQKDSFELNTFKKLINFRNGMWDITKKTLVPHDPKYLSTVQIDRNCPESIDSITKQPFSDYGLRQGLTKTYIYKMLNEKYLLDGATIRVIFEFMAYSMTIENGLKTSVILLGPSNTGKTTLLKVFYGVVGGTENYSTVTMEDLSGQFDTSAVVNKTLNASGENSSKPLEDITNFKIITGNDTGTIEQKYRAKVKAKFFAKCIFCYNTLPTQKGEPSDAFFNRLRILSLLNVLSKDSVPQNIIDSFEEPDGEPIVEITPYLLDMLPLEVISNTAHSRKSVQEMRSDSNSVFSFVNHMCILGSQKEHQMPKQELEQRYSAYCAKNYKESGLTPRELKKKLAELGVLAKKETGTGRAVYKGISFKKPTVFTPLATVTDIHTKEVLLDFTNA